MINYVDFCENLRRNIRERRQAAGWTQQKLADKIGVDRTTITTYEKGKNNPSVYIVYALSKAFGCSIEELIQKRCEHENIEKHGCACPGDS